MNRDTRHLKRCRPEGRPLRGFAADLVTGQVQEPEPGLRDAAARWLIRKMPSPHPAAPWQRVRTRQRPHPIYDVLAWLAEQVRERRRQP